MVKHRGFGITEIMLLVAVLAIVYLAYDRWSKPSGTESVIAKQAPAVAHEPIVEVPIKAPVKTFQGKSKERLKLPAAVQADPNQQVIAASQVKSELRPQTISTVVNTETGKVETFVKQDEYPWLAIENRGELRLAYGYKLDGPAHDVRRVVRLQLGYDVVRVKALTAGVTSTLDTDRQAFIGVGLTYRW